MKLVDRSLQS